MMVDTDLTTGITSNSVALAGELVDALYPQWAVNGHNLAAAFATVADRHLDPAVRHEAAECPLIPAVLSTLEAEFWTRVRVERSALHV